MSLKFFLESMERDLLGLGNADINRDALNVMSNDLSTSVLSFSITQQVVQQLARHQTDPINLLSLFAHGC